jgi:hypothetical protein
MGTNTDPYQPLERDLRITRSILQVLAEFKHPVGIVTKSPAVTRDIDILAPMAAEGLARVAVSITTLDRKLARSMEPRAATPPRRLETIRELANAGIPGDGDVGADHSCAQRRRDGVDPQRPQRMRARRRPATRWCGCRSKSKTCSASGSNRTSPGAEST